ncbi:MAG: DNA primase [Thermoprotei archaeon]|mgnify:CR=1 FL=1|nr:MAG: DNA primase [Thermoprotei archaeon]RLF00563.1 MAG: DNA primase [Thermoprotei archaeon]HDI75054.1 DNA primase [Thermoprotei archaeon]
MGGLAITAKYVIEAEFEIDGVVEKPDVIGAIFGQTEGLLGNGFNLRELQRLGRLGRIEVSLETSDGKTRGRITIPSNLDRVETAIIAAMIESVDKIGPYNAKIRLSRIVDLREEKRKKIIERAIEILRKWEESIPESREIAEEVIKAVRSAEIIKYGPEKLPAGPDVDRSDTIIVVEGRADVVNLVRHGYRNVIALEGASIPKTIIELSKKKTVIAFVDGDRGGDLILKSLLNQVDVDYIARAPPGKEVEELTAKEIAKCLKNKMTVEEYLESIERTKKIKEERVLEKPIKEPFKLAEIPIIEEVAIPPKVVSLVNELQGTLEGVLFDKEWNEVQRVAVRDLVTTLQNTSDIYAVVFDGIVTQRVVDVAQEKGIKVLVGARVGNVVRKPLELTIFTFADLAEKFE